MKILYHFRTRGVGVEAVHIAGIAAAFERMGHQVDFSSPVGVDPRRTVQGKTSAKSMRSAFYGAIARHCPGWIFEFLELGYNLVAWSRNARLLRRSGYDLVFERHAFFLFSTAWLARRQGIPLVVEVNELVGDERVRKQPFMAPLVRACDRFTFARASLIVAVSPHIQRRIQAQGVDDCRLVVLPNAVNELTFSELASPEPVRCRYGFGHSVVLGFIGGLSAWHRLDLLIEVFGRLRQRDLDVRLMIVGDGVEREALAGVARRAGVLEQTLFVGQVSHAEIPSYIAAMDVGVVPHSNEYRSPIKLFEYMGQGKAVVAPRTEPIAAVVRSEVNGLLFEPGSGDGLSGALERLIRDAGLRQRLGEQARQDVLRKHTWTQNARTILNRLSSSTGARG